MTYEEFLGWQNYFERRPIDWRDDDRTYKLLSAQGVKSKPHEIFPSLRSIYFQKPKDKFDSESFKKSFIFQKLLSAKGGDSIL
jgi:hypothetical protein